jgi:hypothetical protein
MPYSFNHYFTPKTHDLKKPICVVSFEVIYLLKAKALPRIRKFLLT